jgi:hypothetical protein
MTSILTNYSIPKVLDAIFGASAIGTPATFYAALFTTAPTASSAGVEVTGGSYARVSITNNSTNFPNTSAQIKSNGTAINWPVSTGAWGTVVAWGLYDASTAGNLWAYGSITSQVLNSGDTMYFSIGALDITF